MSHRPRTAGPVAAGMLAIVLAAVGTPGGAAEPPAAGFQVLRLDGSPLAQATFWLMEIGPANTQTCREATTDAAGRFAWTPKAIGLWRIDVFVDGVGHATTGFFRMAEGQRPPQTPLTLRPAMRVSGRVVDGDTSAPVPGVKVSAWSWDGTTAWHCPPATTDAGGSWTLPTIPAGPWHVWADADAQGYLTSTFAVEVLQGQDVRDVVIRIRRGASLGGLVLAADGKTPVAGASVAASDRRATPVATDVQGRFVLTNLSPGEKALTVTTAGWAQTYAVVVPPDGPAPEQRLVLASRSGSIRGRVISADTGRPLGHSLVAVLPAKTLDLFPLDGWPNTGSEWQRLKEYNDVGYAPESRTDADGRFELKNVVAGDYVVMAFDDVMPKQRSPLVTVAEGQTLEGIALALTRRPQGYLRGRLRRPDGRPLAKTTVRVSLRVDSPRMGQAANIEVTTDSEGRYYLYVGEGKCRLAMAVPGYRILRKEFTAAPSKALTMDFALEPEEANASISGRVFLPDGRTPAAGVVVAPFVKNMLWPEFNGNSYGSRDMYCLDCVRALTGTDGSFRIEGLRPGRYGVVALTRRTGDRPMTVPLRPELAPFLPGMATGLDLSNGGQATDVALTLNRASTLILTVTDALSGRPMPGACIRLLPSDEDGRQMPFVEVPYDIKPDADGRVRLEGLFPGEYQMTVEAPGYRDVARGGANALRLEPDRTLEIAVPLEPMAEGLPDRPSAAKPPQRQPS